MSDIVVNNASALMLDVGGVLGDLNSAKHDGDTVYKSALTGAYCFLQSFKRTSPGIPVHVISRVNRPADNHWVVRFCEELGAGASVHQVKHRHQKGEVARSLGITICVDDAYECVHSMAFACPNWQTGILFGERPTPQGSRHDAWVLQRTIVCGDWGQVASALGCDVPRQVWRWFGEKGPPRQPHNATRLCEAWKLCQVGHVVMLPDQPRIGQGKTGPRKRDDNDEEMPAASAEVKTEGEAAGSEATAPAPEAIAPAPEATAAPAEVIKTEGETAGVASAASAEAMATTAAISPEALAPTAASAVPSGAAAAPPAREEKETAASAVQEGTTAGPAVSAAPASSAAAPAEDKPDWDPLSSSSLEEEDEEELR